MLRKLRRKFRRRAEDRKKQKRLGHALRAARDGRAMRKLRKLIAAVIHRRRGTLAGIRFKGLEPGPRHWAGTADIMGQFVVPFMAKRGLAKGSGKRTPAENAAVGGSPSSDHLTTARYSFARDFPTYSGQDDAAALARAFGIRGWQPNSYTEYHVNIKGRSWRVQILWGVAIGHGDHVHVGIGAL